MSFILDALKKSEAERQRQTGPTLLELRVTHPRRRYPVWATIIGALLAINVIVLLFVALHRPAAAPNIAALPATASAAPAASGTATVSAAKPTVAAAAPAPLTHSTSSAVNGAANSTGTAAVPPLADAAASATAPTTARNPADDEPAVSAPAVGAPAVDAPAQPTPTNYAALPSAIALGDRIPALQLNMLVSSHDPADRYALINMHRVREGDVLPEGARVLAITPDGVAMEYQGQDFLLPRAAAAPPAQ